VVPGSRIRNPLSIVGAWITTVSAFAFIAFYIAESLNLLASPYSGLFGFVAIPVVFLFGLVLIPIGVMRETRRRKQGRPAWEWPAIDLGRSRTRRVFLAVGVLTIVNLAIVAVAGLGAVHYMETDQFCGQVCHVPMKPQFTAHLEVPHARVGCVKCHVGPGASGMVKAKLNGTRQLYSLVTGTYTRPIPSSPARNIPVAADTCLQCHSPVYPERDVTKVTHEYANDEANTDTETTLVHFTGKNHWHTRPGRVVEFVATDEKKGTIPYIKVTEADGKVTEYFAEDVTAAPAGERRHMDCLDCHSRPSHRFIASPQQAADQAIGNGLVSRSLPFVRREMVAALKTEYPNESAAAEGIRQRLVGFYKPADAAKTAEVEQAIAATTHLYRANVFPEMKLTWGTYLSQIGHSDADGCFRCHDDGHKSRDGKVVKQDCEYCHKEPKAQ